MGRQMGRHTGRHAGRHADRRQTDRQAGRHARQKTKRRITKTKMAKKKGGSVTAIDPTHISGQHKVWLALVAVVTDIIHPTLACSMRLRSREFPERGNDARAMGSVENAAGGLERAALALVLAFRRAG